jgi:hypothetical protein
MLAIVVDLVITVLLFCMAMSNEKSSLLGNMSLRSLLTSPPVVSIVTEDNFSPLLRILLIIQRLPSLYKPEIQHYSPFGVPPEAFAYAEQYGHVTLLCDRVVR